MNAKTIIYILIAIVVVFGAFYLFNSSQNSPTQTSQGQTQPAQTTTTTTTTSSTTTTGIPAVTSAKTVTVSVVNFSFNPATLTINKGDTVTWTNNDSVPHQIAGAPLQGQVMSKGQTYSFTFNTTGTFNYHCAIHPSMTGSIVVN